MRLRTWFNITGIFHGYPVVITEHGDWAFDLNREYTFATFADAERVYRRLIAGGTSATHIRINGV